MKADIHVHLIPPSLSRRGDLPSLTPEALWLRCRAGGAERVLIQGWPFQSLEDCRAQNQAVLAAVREAPEHFRGLCTVPPSAGEAALAEAERCLEWGCSGVGELDPVRQGFSLEDPAFQALCALCERRDRILALTLHMDMAGDPKTRNEAAPRLTDCLRLIERHPNLRLLLPHYGGGLPFYALMPEVANRLGNVWFDTAPDGCPFLPHGAESARLCLGAEAARILFGSHLPGPVFDPGPCWDVPEEWEAMLR